MLVAQALQFGPRADRCDPATLAVGALVLLAFWVDLRLARDPEGWMFAFTKPLSTNIIGKLLGHLLGTYSTSNS